MARSGAVATSDPRATHVGAEILRSGGNAVDAAVGAVLTLFVVEPHYCGPGGDAFLLVHESGDEQPNALDGAGAVPIGLTPAALEADGLHRVPPFGPRSVTVPGVVGFLESALERYGTRSLAQLTPPAVELAEQGFSVRRTLADACRAAREHIVEDEVLSELYAPDGEPLAEGAMVTNPRLAEFLEALGREGSPLCYQGAVAEEIVNVIAGGGGYLSEDDLSEHRTDTLVPESTGFRSARVWELPAPTQGPAVLTAVEELERMDDFDWSDVRRAVTAGLAAVGIDLSRRELAATRPQSNTSYVATLDGEGRAASLITSIFAPFGARVGVPSLGGPLHNRAAGFLVTGEDPRPGKPPHTIIPALVTRDGRVDGVLGVAGGLMQAQGQVQLLVRTLVEGLDPQEAIDAPRFRVLPGGELALEPGHPLADSEPDAVGRPPGDGGFGAGQVVRLGDGTVTAGADARRDGAAEVVEIPGPDRRGGQSG